MTFYTLTQVIEHARENSPFYRSLYAALPPGRLALDQLPVVDQEAFWRANVIGPWNRLLTGPLNDAIVFKSGGTTGSPKFSVYSREEWNTFCAAFGRGMSQSALEKGDRVANLFYAGDLYASFLFIHGSLERAHAPALNLPIAGATPADSIARTIFDFDVNVLAGVPTTLVTLAEQFIARQIRLPSVKKVLFGGEALYPDQLDRLQMAFPGVVAHTIGYASVDAGLLGFGSLDCESSEHRAFEPETIVEIICEETGLPIRQPGRPGRLVVTNLTRLLMPIIRYPAGDRAEWIEGAGSAQRKFRLLGRAEEAARVGPVSIYYEDLRELLDGFRAHIPSLGSFQLVVERPEGRDQLTIRVSGQPVDSEQAAHQILQALQSSRPMLRDLCLQGKIAEPRVEWVAPGLITVNTRTGKLRRVIDLR